MSLATEENVTDRLGRELTESETGRVESLLDDASAVVIGYCGKNFEPEPYPPAVVGVVAKMVARVLERGSTEGGSFVDEENAGPFSRRFSAASSSGDVWLTAADKLALRGSRRGGGLTSVQFVGERYNVTESSDESSSSSSSSSSS